MRKNPAPVAAAALALLAAGAGCGGDAHRAEPRVPRAGGSTWSTLDAGPIAGREGVAVGADDRWLVAWGGTSGSGADAAARDDGAVYDSTTRSWAPMPQGPLSARHDAAAVWAGRRLYIMGGSSSANLNGAGDLRNGASFEPATGVWRSVDATPTGDRRRRRHPFTGHGRRPSVTADPGAGSDAGGGSVGADRPTTGRSRDLVTMGADHDAVRPLPHWGTSGSHRGRSRPHPPLPHEGPAHEGPAQ